MKIKELIKQDAGFQYIIDSMELMSAAGRRKMLNTEFCADAYALRAEWPWPEAPTRGAYAKWLVARLARKEADGRTPAVRSADPHDREVARSA